MHQAIPPRYGPAKATPPRAHVRLGLSRGVVASLIAVSTVAMSGLSTRPTARTVPVGLAPVAVAIDEQTHRAFVAKYGDASLSVLDARSGTCVATITVPLQPSLLAIAAAAGRLFVAANTADAAGHSIVTVLDAANGQRLRTVAVGTGASAIEDSSCPGGERAHGAPLHCQ